eukprot:CAMPEP_0203840620 /NCGR_PEP_ID=MMETSP0359-20131031/890_1 /ASSEMBLY_ACC=CAM_ASM_000338 /TAXON_ID=268821 /ORGANISM="Scrippsiella Hangoei, Strain SHTV-5" /LENGTH=109 /DNA_ID=CAMNT_0050754865 /DNA_START=1 /DNA_END=330 /DNA_ORIENTATION=+
MLPARAPGKGPCGGRQWLLLLSAIRQEVLQAVLGELNDPVKHAIDKVGCGVAFLVLGVIEQLHEEVGRLHLVQLLIPQGRVLCIRGRQAPHRPRPRFVQVLASATLDMC